MFSYCRLRNWLAGHPYETERAVNFNFMKYAVIAVSNVLTTVDVSAPALRRVARWCTLGLITYCSLGGSSSEQLGGQGNLGRGCDRDRIRAPNARSERATRFLSAPGEPSFSDSWQLGHPRRPLPRARYGACSPLRSIAIRRMSNLTTAGLRPTRN